MHFSLSGLLRTGVRRGLMGGHRGWQAIFLVATVLRFVGRTSKRGSGPVLFSEKLKAGETLEICHKAPSAEEKNSA